MTDMSKTILSLDGATKTGWAIYQDGYITQHGTKAFDRVLRNPQYGSWLSEMINKHKVTEVVAEDIYRDASHTRDNAFHTLAQMQGVADYITYTHNVPLTLIDPRRIKDCMLGTFCKYNSDLKAKMICRVEALGYKLEHAKAHDEADAIGILITYLKRLDLPLYVPRK